MNNPRRFPGLLRAHSLLIALTFAVACGAVVLRAADGWEPLQSATSRGISPSPVLADTGGEARPPSRPSPTLKSIGPRLAAAGYNLPPRGLVYGAEIARVADGLSYRQFEAGLGALNNGFWPASSIKLFAALGALDFARSLGFTGDALVVTDIGQRARSLRAIYESAIRDSSNDAYDLLVQIAGLDRLNGEFLTAANGFPATSIVRSYAGTNLEQSPAMIFEQDNRRAFVPERTAKLAPECAAGNCTNLFEMTESIRRVVLSSEIPAGERFNIDPADIAALTAALLDADSFFTDPAKDVMGPGVRIYNKSGDAEDRDCLDVALLETPSGRRYLLAASVPHREDGCYALLGLATAVLRLEAG